ncbi:hypothetical protein L1887_62425 [Cichorium endivia]|nr:hypothetical protein L1887_62425 [Cichorium endivia]
MSLSSSSLDDERGELLDLDAEAMGEHVGGEHGDADELIHEHDVAVLVKDARHDLGHAADGGELLFACELELGIVRRAAECSSGARHVVGGWQRLCEEIRVSKTRRVDACHHPLQAKGIEARTEIAS